MSQQFVPRARPGPNLPSFRDLINTIDGNYQQAGMGDWGASAKSRLDSVIYDTKRASGYRLTSTATSRPKDFARETSAYKAELKTRLHTGQLNGHEATVYEYLTRLAAWQAHPGNRDWPLPSALPNTYADAANCVSLNVLAAHSIGDGMRYATGRPSERPLSSI